MFLILKNNLINFIFSLTLSLDNKLPSIYKIEFFNHPTLPFLFTFQQFVDFVFLQGFFLINLLVLIYIYYILLWNIFYFSIKYFIVNFIFTHKKLILPNLWCFWFDRALRWWGYRRKLFLPYMAADGMFNICCFVALLIVYNIFLYLNIVWISLPQEHLTLFVNLTFFKWISTSFDSINFGFLLDNLSLLMLVVVLGISTLVHYYSIDYMATDPWLLTFMKYLSGFTLAMVILVTGNNFALVFLGWEGVGIFSYLLIGFWYTWTLALKASLKAVIVNKIGDVAFVLSCGLILHYFGTLEFKKLHYLISYMMETKIEFFTMNFVYFWISLITLVCFFLLIAAIGKSAQFGLHTWLPDAMEGPTPVSALIHAATMVTAGVYLLVWSSFLLEFSEIIKTLTLLIGAFTALFGSITACFQYDIKWIIAFSTCSQLGYMFLACGLSAYNLAMFHLFIHAFFKALLFLCAGSVIHAIGDEQDIRKMGGLYGLLPITYTGLCIGFFSLAGLPFTSGFFSKDTIIELAFSNRTIPGLYSYICASLAAWFTGFYSFWFFYYVIFNETSLSWTVISKTSEHGSNILAVLTVLSLITIFIGGITKNPLTSSFSFLLFSDSIFIKDNNFYFNLYEFFIDYYEIIHEYVLNYFKIIVFITPFLAIYISIIIFWEMDLWQIYDMIYEEARMDCMHNKKLSTDWIVDKHFFNDVSLQRFFETKGGTDQVYNKFIVKPIINFSYYISYKELDWGWLEFFFIKIPIKISLFFSKVFNQNFGSLKLNFLPAMFFLIGLVISLIFLN